MLLVVRWIVRYVWQYSLLFGESFACLTMLFIVRRIVRMLDNAACCSANRSHVWQCCLLISESFACLTMLFVVRRIAVRSVWQCCSLISELFACLILLFVCYCVPMKRVLPWYNRHGWWSVKQSMFRVPRLFGCVLNKLCSEFPVCLIVRNAKMSSIQFAIR